MKNLPLIVLIVVVVLGGVFLVTRNASRNADSQPTIEDLERENNVDLFPINQTQTTSSNSDFVSGAPYLFFESGSQQEMIYQNTTQDEIGTRAVFTDPFGKEYSFYPSVVFVVSNESDVKDVRKWIKNNEQIIDSKEFDALNMFSITYQTNYEAYLSYVELQSDSRLKGVGLDKKVTYSEDEKQNIQETFGISVE